MTEIQNTDETYMREALRQAKKAAGPWGGAHRLRDRPCDGQIIARGYNRRNTDKNTLSHAELNAIKKASKKSRRLAAGGLHHVCDPGALPDVRRRH